MARPRRRFTLEEFLRLPEETPALEYLHGKVTRKPWPTSWHGCMQGEFVIAVNQYAEPRHLALAFPETRVTFGDASLVPDVGIYRWDNVPRQPDGKLLDESTTPWDIVAEVMSTDQSREEIEDKCRWFLANGAEIAVVIDPDLEEILRLGSDGSRVELRGDDRIDLDAILPGFSLTVKALFMELLAD